jgi:outer membrane protein OmpA-like peptidoglycan-associated protein
MKSTSLLLALLVALAPTAARAAEDAADAAAKEEEARRLAAVKALGKSEVQLSALAGLHVFNRDGILGRANNRVAGTAIDTAPQFGARISYLPIQRFAAEFMATTTPSSTSESVGVGVHAALLHANLFVLTGRVRPFVFAGGGIQLLTSSDTRVIETDLRPVGDLGAGMAVDIGDFWGVRADARVRAVPGMESAVAADGVFGLALFSRFPPPPKPPPLVPVIVDSDRDGLADKLDRCPREAGSLRNDGCPITSDRDHDGVLDAQDQCPDEIGTAATRGCADPDGDGFYGTADACPTQAGQAIDNGCPPVDTDGDGLVDRLDRCPKEPETKNGLEDDDGCPDELPKAVVPPPEPPPPPPAITKAAQSLDFQTGSAVLTPASQPFLDTLANELKIAGTARLEVVGHTDDRGNEALNTQLSQRRAEAVRAELLKRGVAADRIVATGKGSSEPIASNDTEEGRKKNRRVVFNVLPNAP